MSYTDLNAEIISIIAEVETIPFSFPGAPSLTVTSMGVKNLERRLKESICHAEAPFDSRLATRAYLSLAERFQWKEMGALELFRRAAAHAKKSELKKEEALALFGQGVALDGVDPGKAEGFYSQALKLASKLTKTEGTDFDERATNLARTLGDSALEHRVLSRPRLLT